MRIEWCWKDCRRLGLTRQCAIRQAYSMAMEVNEKQADAYAAGKRKRIEVKSEAYGKEEMIQIPPTPETPANSSSRLA